MNTSTNITIAKNPKIILGMGNGKAVISFSNIESSITFLTLFNGDEPVSKQIANDYES